MARTTEGELQTVQREIYFLISSLMGGGRGETLEINQETHNSNHPENMHF